MLTITNLFTLFLLFRTKWLPVNISVKDGVLVIKRSTPPSMPISSSTVVPPDTPPLHEFRLHHNHMTTPPQLRPYDRKTKLHQIKLRQTQVIMISATYYVLYNFFIIGAVYYFHVRELQAHLELFILSFAGVDFFVFIVFHAFSNEM